MPFVPQSVIIMRLLYSQFPARQKISRELGSQVPEENLTLPLIYKKLGSVDQKMIELWPFLLGHLDTLKILGFAKIGHSMKIFNWPRSQF